MGYNEFSNIGEQIRDAMEDAITSMDFKHLNKTISDTVNDAVDEVRRQFTDNSRTGCKRRYEHTNNDHDVRDEPPRSSRSSTTEYTSSASNTYQYQKVPKQNFQKQKTQTQSAQPQKVHTQNGPKSGKIINNLRIHPPSRVKGILLTVFGSIGLGLTVAGLLSLLVISIFSTTVWGATWGLNIFLLILAGIFGGMIVSGNSIRGQLARLKLYLKEADNKTYCSIRELVGCTGRSEKFVIKDLKKMIKNGILPHAHLDEKNTCLMLDDKTYDQYLQSMESLKIRTQEAASIQSRQQEKTPEANNRVSKVTSEGQSYLKALRDANDAIPGEMISSKLDRLEIIIEKIFDVIDRHPEQLDDIERFMEYYLPTTVKLVNAYRDFDSVGIDGENISMAKTEVEATLDTINQAFEQLLDGLYQDEAFDISTDATVLQTMLKKDGFVNSDFDRREES